MGVDFPDSLRDHKVMMDENTLEFTLGFAFLILIFLGLYGLTRALAWLDRYFESRKRH
ncbi:MAG: hypothetical protein ACK2U1_02690 [Anaerolineales bacterium]|jgi:hypothetical protein